MFAQAHRPVFCPVSAPFFCLFSAPFLPFSRLFPVFSPSFWQLFFLRGADVWPAGDALTLQIYTSPLSRCRFPARFGGFVCVLSRFGTFLSCTLSSGTRNMLLSVCIKALLTLCCVFLVFAFILSLLFLCTFLACVLLSSPSRLAVFSV